MGPMVKLRPPEKSMEEQSFWAELVPELSVTDLPWDPEREPHAVSDQLESYKSTGIAAFESVLPEADTRALASCLDVLTERGIPTPFLFIFDETWRCYQQLDHLISQLMGPDYLLGGDLWAWSLDPIAGAHGWTPHVDSMFKVPDLHESGDPNYASLWISLTDADESNGCIRAVPRDALDVVVTPTTPNLKDLAQSLEVPEGSMLSWAPDIVHWGGAVDESAGFGRKSFAVFAQRGDMPALTWDMVKIGEAIPFNYRLGIISRQLLRYSDSSLHSELSALRQWQEFAQRQETRFSRFLALMATLHGRYPETVR